MNRSSDAHRRRRLAAGFACVSAMLLGTGCRQAPELVLTRLIEARRVVADLRLQFTRAADASNRAVMADTDQASSAAAQEAGDATQTILRETQALQPVLRDLGYAAEIGFLNAFDARFGEYRALDRTILELAVENTNLKAQRLAFGPAREAAEEFRRHLDAAGRSAAPSRACEVQALVARAGTAVREIQLLEAPHIAESDEGAMSRMEAQMADADTSARRALDSLNGLLSPSPELSGAVAALARFTTIHTEIVGLSRRNSNVRSLALSLGRKRTLTAACDDSLRALQEALDTHDFTATR